MRSELELVREYCELYAARAENPRAFPPEAAFRLAELKSLYDQLLGSRRLSRVPPGERFTRQEILSSLPARDRLRVPLALPVFYCHGNDYAPARSANVSSGGVFLETALPPTAGSSVTLYMPNLGSGYESLLENEAEVVWTSSPSAFPRGMGLRFGRRDAVQMQQLDELILRFLRERLSRTTALPSGPAWVKRRSTSV